VSWCNRGPDIGHLFNSQMMLRTYLRIKRKKLISQINALLCYLGKLNLVVKFAEDLL